MVSPLDILEERISSATNLIASLRAKASRLEKDLAAARSLMTAGARQQSLPPAVGSDQLGVIEQLRAERALVRERIRDLIREIDRVTR